MRNPARRKSRVVIQRRVPKLIFGDALLGVSYRRDSQRYEWFRKGENRFKATGLHGFTGGLFFQAFDRGLKALPFEEYREAFRRDAALHTQRRFAELRSKLKVAA